MSMKLIVAAALAAPFALGCSSSPTTGSVSLQYTYKDCYKNTSEYLVGVTYSCTPKTCPSTTQCPDVYHELAQFDSRR